MWFKKKQNSSDQSSKSSRSGDMHSELGLSGETHQAVRVRSRTAPRDGMGVSAAVYDEEVQLHDLKIRARRRLIGAAILLAAAFVILPWVFDGQRKQTAAEVSVAIPEKNVQFDVQNPRATDESLKAAAANADQPPATTNQTDNKPVTAPANTAVPAKPAEPKPVATPEKPVPEPKVANRQYAVHIGVVSDRKELDALLSRLRAAGVQPQLKTVKVDGVSKTRVRLGLFKTQAEAEAAANKARAAAKNPVVIPVEPEKAKPQP